MVLPKLLFLHLSQFCLPHWIQVHSFGTPKTSASFKVVLLWSCASCWWRCCPSPLQWWCVTREGMTALGRLTSALCPTCTMQCLTNRDREEEFLSRRLLGEKSIKTAAYFASWGSLLFAALFLCKCCLTIEKATSGLKPLEAAWTRDFLLWTLN